MYRANPTEGAAWVTGASSGIGRGVALELARRGYKVLATARREGELVKLAAEASGFTGKIIPAPGDISDRDGQEAQVERMEAEHGPLSLAFLNAGTYVPDPPGEFGGDGFRETFELNVFGTVNSLAPLVRRMCARRKGQIAVMSSVAGYGGMPRSISYSASKSAIIAMCEALKFDLDKDGVTLQIVCPGFVKTPLTSLNKFEMPFLMELDDATQRICDGFEKAGFEIAFPRRMSWSLKLLNMLPYSLYFPILKKRTGDA
jgi:NAD(P)-dependent dehydrogenase (short-subunit alcohol dehydrogenase family)